MAEPLDSSYIGPLAFVHSTALLAFSVNYCFGFSESVLANSQTLSLTI